MNFITNYFRQPEQAQQLEDKSKIVELYAKYRNDIFVACFVGYTFFHLCKKNIGVALPSMGADLGCTNMQLGILGSALYFTYAFGKFINGVLADRADSKKFFSFALLISALCNIMFGLSYFICPPNNSFFGLPSTKILLFMLAFFWGVNGWFQSMGFPSIAKSLTHWFANSERGTKWALWSTSHQFGTLVTIFVTGIIVKYFGWQSAFIIPGIINIFVSIYLFKKMKDRPVSVGLPDVEIFIDKKEPEKQTEDNEAGLSYLQIFMKYILFNKTIWLLAIAYIFVYIIRFGSEDWIIKYLVEAKNNPIEAASFKLGCLSFFGIAGVITAGYFSDKIFKGRRTPINVIYLVCLGFSIVGLIFTPSDWSAVDTLLISMIGFFTSGPQMLIGGLCAVESSSKKVASATCGFTGIFGYVGAIFSSTGTGYCVDKWGWNGALIFWAVSAFVCVLICSMLLKADKVKTN